MLATHGHVDHTWDAGRLSAALDVPVVLHAADAYRLADPFGTLGVLGEPVHDPRGPLAQALAAVGVDPAAYAPPARVETFGAAADPRAADVTSSSGGLRDRRAARAGAHRGLHAVPGRRRRGPVAFTGDVLFAGTIGRTDLPGGDRATMARTLREVVATLPPETVVVPGHGPTSDIATELRAQPVSGGPAAG